MGIQNTKNGQLGTNDIFNLGKGNVRSLSDFVKIILKNLKMSTDITSNPLIELAPTPGGEVLFTSADLTKSKKILGYSPDTDLEQGVPEFIGWYQNEWKPKEKVQKKYLLISTFYIAMNDPLRMNQNDIQYSYDTEFAINFIKGWYESIKSVMNIDDLSLAEIDCVIIHDGLSKDVFIHFKDIIFVNMGQFPNPLKGHASRRSPNDIRYFHIFDYLQSSEENEYEIVIITDLHDVMFGQDPFKYLTEKKIMDSNDLYVGCEVTPKQSLWSKFRGENKLKTGMWYNWVQDRLNGCFKDDVVQKCLKWIDSKHAIPTNPGIIAANKVTMIKYLNQIKAELIKTKQHNTKKEQNCNYAAVLVSIVELCYEDKQCNPINDETFHSPYREFKKPQIDDNQQQNQWVIYHKR